MKHLIIISTLFLSTIASAQHYAFGVLRSIQIGDHPEHVFNLLKHEKQQPYKQLENGSLKYIMIADYKDVYGPTFKFKYSKEAQYHFKNDALTHIQIRYWNISDEKFVELFETLFIKKGKFYFTQDYTHYYKLVSTSIIPEAHYYKTEVANLPASIREEINTKLQKLQAQKQAIQGELYELKSLDNKEYTKIMANFSRQLTSSLYNAVRENRKTNRIKVYENTCSLRLEQAYTSDQKRGVKTNKLVEHLSGSDKDCKLLNSLNLILPNINHEGYPVRSFITIGEVPIMGYSAFRMDVKWKKGVITLPSGVTLPHPELEKALKTKLANEKSGKYELTFTFVLVKEKELINNVSVKRAY